MRAAFGGFIGQGDGISEREILSAIKVGFTRLGDYAQPE
jgi:hypothetical protein